MPFITRLTPTTVALGIVLVMAVSHVQAEVVTIDVTVKAIDAKERSITVTKTTKSKSKDIELEVAKKAKISIGGKDAGLEAVKVGQKASVSYETELEVVTKIEISGTAAAEPKTAAPKKDDPKDDAEGFEALLSDEGLDGWYFKDDPKSNNNALNSKKPNWENKNGLLVYKTVGPSLASDKQFGDFEMQLEFKLPKDCNCGVRLRGRYEVKLTDTPKGSATSLNPSSRIGAIYSRIVPTKNTYKGTNQWNKLEVKLVGKTVTVKINDETVIDEKEIAGRVDGFGDAPIENEDTPGPIIFNAHPKGPGATFRNIKVKTLGTE